MKGISIRGIPPLPFQPPVGTPPHLIVTLVLLCSPNIGPTLTLRNDSLTFRRDPFSSNKMARKKKQISCFGVAGGQNKLTRFSLSRNGCPEFFGFL